MVRLFETISSPPLEVVSRFDPTPVPYMLITRQEASGNVVSRKRVYGGGLIHATGGEVVDERLIHAELNYG